MLVGLTGASGSGKTYSALRLATGMQRVTGGDIFYVDTESRRALHYADEFKFRHVPMEAPFSPLDYLEAIRYCSGKNAGVLIIDSMSHEHEGPGGVLDMHETILDRMAGSDFKKRDRMTFSAWAKPKAERRKLINEVLRMGVNAILCFRAKEKIKIAKGQDGKNEVVKLGWQAIAGDEYVYEMTVNCLLYPGSKGVPVWNPDEKSEHVKRMDSLAPIFPDGQPLSEEAGYALGQWASGVVAKPDEYETDQIKEARAAMAAATDVDSLSVVMNDLASLEWTEVERSKLKTIAMNESARVKGAA